jgi:hypothetical protein
MTISKDAFESQIPYYLTGEKRAGLKKALKDFQVNTPIEYYLNKYPNELLQGDGWRGLELLVFQNAERRMVKGVILSNTCDVSIENARSLSSKIIFCPLIKLSNYKKQLNESGISDNKVHDKLKAIRDQHVSTIFYLPQGSGLRDEHIIFLDDIYSLPSDSFQANTGKSKLFTLSMIGFYLFIFKLSIHFCRFHEEVDR